MHFILGRSAAYLPTFESHPPGIDQFSSQFTCLLYLFKAIPKSQMFANLFISSQLSSLFVYNSQRCLVEYSKTSSSPQQALFPANSPSTAFDNGPQSGKESSPRTSTSASHIFYAPENNSTRSSQEVNIPLLPINTSIPPPLLGKALFNQIIVKEALARGKQQHIVHCDWFEISAVNDKKEPERDYSMRNILAKQNAAKRELARIEKGKREGERAVNTSKIYVLSLQVLFKSLLLNNYLQICFTFTSTESFSHTKST